jgi:hypothetical protein
LRPTGAFFQDQRRHQADIEFRHLAPGIGGGVERHVERALADRAELGVGLHQRRAGIDLHLHRTLRALLERRRELAAHPVAEVALVDRAAGELVRELQGRGGLSRAGPELEQSRRGKPGREEMAAVERHGVSSSNTARAASAIVRCFGLFAAHNIRFSAAFNARSRHLAYFVNALEYASAGNRR